MIQDFNNIVILTGLFLALFGSAELVFYFFEIQAEYTRKYVHFTTGLLTLFFPLMFSSQWSVLLICSAFLLLLTISLKFKFLNSINAIGRFTLGSVVYPIVVYICFFVYSLHLTHSIIKPYIWFYLPIMIMATADPLAALIGRKWPIKTYKVGNETKSWLGSIVFFVTAFIIGSILFHILLPQHNFSLSVLISFFIISIITTFTEAYSKNGLDNFTIPISALIVMEVLNFYLYIFN